MSNVRHETSRRIVDELRRERDEWRVRCQQVEAKLEKRLKPCPWVRVDDVPKFWLTDCGVAVYGADAGYEYNFCPRCGGPIEVLSTPRLPAANKLLEAVTCQS